MKILRIETRKSKAGNEYSVLVIEICPGFTKDVYLSKEELKIIELTSKNGN